MSDSDDDEVDMSRTNAQQGDDEDESDDEEVRQAGDVKNEASDDDDDDVSDDEDDEEEEDERRGKKRKKNDGSKYVDMEAGEDDSDEDEDDGGRRKGKKSRHHDDDDDEDAELTEMQADREMGAAIKKRTGPDFMNQDDLDASYFTNRYRSVGEEEEEEMDDETSKNSRLPDARKDPQVWSVKVANGQEQSLVIQLLQKFVTLSLQGQPMHVTAVYCNGQTQGYLYIEARKHAFVKEALAGIRGIFHTKLHLIPNKEMVDTVTVVKKTAAAMASGSGWARIKRGKYKTDIAKILSIDSNKNEVEVRLVPRVDTTDYSHYDDSEAKKRKAKAIPVRRLFKPDEHKTDDLLKWEIEETRDENLENCWLYEGYKFEFDENGNTTGFLKKSYPVKSLQLGSEVQPELDELKLFEAAQETNAEQGAINTSLGHLTSIHKRKVQLQKGDVVRVKEGELRDLLGDVDAINGDTVILRPRHDAIKQKLEFRLSELEKYFEPGDHVKVVGGRKSGVTGTVVRVEGEIIYLLTDISHDEIRVFSADLQDTTEVSTGLDVVGVYKLYDLVLLESAGVSMTIPSVGVVVKLEKDAIQVLDNNNKLRPFRPSDVQLQKKSATAVALDSEQQTIGQGDAVKIVDGQFKGRNGTVRHVFRAFLFLYSPNRMENSGIFCVRSRQCTLMGQSKHTENAVPNATLGGGMIPGGRGGGRGMIPGQMGRGGGPPMMGGGRGRGAGWEGKRVRILKGFDRNKIGTVKEETETVCRVELDATHKRVAVLKDADHLAELGAPTIQRRPMPEAQNMFSSAGAQTPSWTPSTPGFDGSMTPSHESASTPSTPRLNYFDSASTPHDEQPFTPATPGGFAGASPYDQSAQTPATPGASYGGYSGYGATPGGATPGDMTHTPHTPMTPGAWSGHGATPVFSGSAQTPWDNATPATPATPGSEFSRGGAAAPQTKNWCLRNIEVRVVSGEFIDKTGIVVELVGAETTVRLENGSTTTVPAEDLEAVPPQKNSSVIILQGDLLGATGKLIGIDGRDGIVKMDLNSDIKIVDMPSLAVHAP